MKRLFTICILMMPFLIHAQGFSVKSSLALSKWDGDNSWIDHENLTGYSVGVYYDIPLNENFSLSLGSRYISDGTVRRFSESLDFFSITYHELLVVQAYNIQIPVLAKYYLQERVYLMIGPYASFLLTDDTNITYTECIEGLCTGEKEKLDIDDMLESSMMGMELGIGTVLLNKLLIEVNYLKGLSTVIDDAAYHDKNQSLMFTLGYKF